VSNDAVFNAFPQLAVDRTSNELSRGDLPDVVGHAAWDSTEVLMSDSLNLGLSFSFLGRSRHVAGDADQPSGCGGQRRASANCYYVTATNTPTSSSNYFYNA